mmetsp:Transcript_177805/g.570191  ORF Transcript_177805/g.570191 Transcript_177805/m.570191 type:complete len:260 (+) Transcript_177805:3399-4178(+)
MFVVSDIQVEKDTLGAHLLVAVAGADGGPWPCHSGRSRASVGERADQGAPSAARCAAQAAAEIRTAGYGVADVSGTTDHEEERRQPQRDPLRHRGRSPQDLEDTVRQCLLGLGALLGRDRDGQVARARVCLSGERHWSCRQRAQLVPDYRPNRQRVHHLAGLRRRSPPLCLFLFQASRGEVWFPFCMLAALRRRWQRLRKQTGVHGGVLYLEVRWRCRKTLRPLKTREGSLPSLLGRFGPPGPKRAQKEQQPDHEGVQQ